MSTAPRPARGPAPLGTVDLTSPSPSPSLLVPVRVPAELVDALADAVADRLAAREAERAEPWVGVDQAAEHIAAPRSRVYALVSAGRIPHERDGSRLLFRRSALDGWLRGGGGVRP